MTDQTAAIEVWARMLCAADVHVHGADHPTWQQTGSKIRDDYRKAAAWLLPRLTVAVSSAGPAPATDRNGLVEIVAQAIWARTPDAEPSRTGLVMGNPHGIAADVVDALAAALLPAPDQRAAVLLEAADIAEDVALRLRGECLLDQVNGAYEVMSELRRRAGEAQQAPTDEDVVEAHRLALSLAIGLGTGGPWDVILERAAELHAAETAAHAAQQDPTQDGTEAHPAAVAWKIETPLRGEWRHTGATYDDHAWASERYQDAIENDPDREFRLVRVTTAYTVEAEHNPAAVARPGQPETEAAVEGWARALAGARVLGQAALPFDQLPPEQQDAYREQARTILGSGQPADTAQQPKEA